MRIAITGATGFLGRYIVRELANAGHALRCWHRPQSDLSGFDGVRSQIEWLPGELGDEKDSAALVTDCQAVVHAALYHPGGGFRGGEGSLIPFVEKNLLGTLKLIEAARKAGVERFVFISTCAVHEKILDDRPLDEAHPLWASHHYGAHKAAIEKFIHSYGLGEGYPICALRPTGIYGAAHPIGDSKWYDLVQRVVRSESVACRRGGKEVHAADVARGVSLLLAASPESITGEAFNCYDRYISDWDVAHLARELCGSASKIDGQQTVPRHEIVTEKIQHLGMTFGGEQLLRDTIRQLVDAAGR